MAAKAMIPFLVGMMLLTGVCNTLLTKYQDMQCTANCDAPDPRSHKTFEQPVLQTLQMFIGEAGCWIIVLLTQLLARAGVIHGSSITSRTAYQPVSNRDEIEDEEELDSPIGGYDSAGVDATGIASKAVAAPELRDDFANEERVRIPLEGWNVLLLALPAGCDIIGTTLINIGLLFVAASICQMTRGALVLFVGLFSVLFLKRHLGIWKWASLIIVVAGVGLVGLAGYLESKTQKLSVNDDSFVGLMTKATKEAITLAKEHSPLETLMGVGLVAGAQIFTATQFVLEESIMEKYAMDPVRVVGWEGTFGFSITLFAMAILHLTVGRTDAGRGGYFDASEGFGQMFAHKAIGITSVMIMISIGAFNYFGLTVTRTISATARSTIDTCRTLFIWLVSLGLGWETFKWLQVPGFVLLVYGTALFNEIVRPPTIEWIRRKIRGTAFG